MSSSRFLRLRCPFHCWLTFDQIWGARSAYTSRHVEHSLSPRSLLCKCAQASDQSLQVFAAVSQALRAGAGVVTSIGRLDCATLVLDGYLPVHPGLAGATASAATLTVELRAGRAAAACAGGAFAGGSASTDVAIRCGAERPEFFGSARVGSFTIPADYPINLERMLTLLVI